MRKFFLRFLSLITAALFASANCVTVYAAESITEPSTIEIVKGSDIALDTVVIMDNFVCITVESEESEDASPYAYTEKETTKSFVHTITDRNGNFIATFTTIVSGIYSYADNYATITSVTGSFSNAVITGLSYTVSYSGSTATVYITLNGATIGSLSYKLYTNGSLLEV